MYKHIVILVYTSRSQWISRLLLCVCSDQDPSGLLLLPPKGAPSDFDISSIRSVMETLLLVATREVRPQTRFQYVITIHQQPTLVSPYLHIPYFSDFFSLTVQLSSVS